MDDATFETLWATLIGKAEKHGLPVRPVGSYDDWNAGWKTGLMTAYINAAALVREARLATQAKENP